MKVPIVTKPAAWTAALAATIMVATAATAVAAPVSSPPNVPAEFATEIATAPLQCGHDEITSELIAAEVSAESDWKVPARSVAGAEGPAQLFPATFAVYGADDDGNGVASPYDIGDAIGALVRLGCSNVSALKAQGRAADPVTIITVYIGGFGSIDNPEVREQALRVWEQR